MQEPEVGSIFFWGGPRRLGAAFALGVLTLAVGCGERAGSTPPAARPRPVTVIALRSEQPARADRVAGTVASWKTEDLGFEVSGRVRFVVEPETEVEGPVTDDEGKTVVAGTILGQIDEERYRLRVRSTESQIAAAQRQRDAVQTEVTRVIPAQERGAEADRAKEKAGFDRAKKLFPGTITQEEYDRAQASYQVADARVVQLAATREAKEAEGLALEAEVEQLRATLDESQRDLADGTLRAPYHGQVAQVHVIPGGYVERGKRVLTLQMMDPMKVEVEVSAETLRRLRYNDRLAVWLDLPGGQEVELEGGVYQLDTAADPATRTYTVTLLTRNRKTALEIPPEFGDKPLPRTRHVWGLQPDPEFPEKRLIEAGCVQRDADGAYLWRVVDGFGRGPAAPSAVLRVEKVRIELGPRRINVLGLWKFQEVLMPSAAGQGPPAYFVGKLEGLPEGETELSGEAVILDRRTWLLRPGDVVRVDLRSEALSPGWYLPTDAVLREGDRASLFVVTDAGAQGLAARKVAVRLGEVYGTRQRIEPAEAGGLREGDRVVAAGTHFLVDGESVLISAQREAAP